MSRFKGLESKLTMDVILLHDGKQTQVTLSEVKKKQERSAKV